MVASVGLVFVGFLRLGLLGRARGLRGGEWNSGAAIGWNSCNGDRHDGSRDNRMVTFGLNIPENNVKYTLRRNIIINIVFYMKE